MTTKNMNFSPTVLEVIKSFISELEADADIPDFAASQLEDLMTSTVSMKQEQINDAVFVDNTEKT